MDSRITDEQGFGVSLMKRSDFKTTAASAVATVPFSVRQPAAVAQARMITGEFLRRLEPAVAPESAGTVVLVVSELVTNALRHAGGTCSLQLTANAGYIDVAVRDGSPCPPLMRTPDLNGGTGGFGWPMVHRLASAVAVSSTEGGGKTVRARLRRNDSGEA